MLLLSLGDIPFLREVVSSLGVDMRLEVSSCDIASRFPLPVLSSHEEYEKYAEQNNESIRKIVDELKEKPVCVLWPNNESGIFLVLLEYLVEKFGPIDVILFTQNFAATQEKKLLSKILLGVLYNFLNVGIYNMFWFSFDIMRKLYKDLKIVNMKEWVQKSIVLFYKKVVFSTEKPVYELAGESVWSVNEMEEVKKLGRLVILSEHPITEEAVTENGLYIYKVVYCIANCEDFDDSALEKEIEKKTEVVREYRLYNIGTSDLLEYYVIFTRRGA